MAIRQNKEEVVLEFIDNIYNEVRAKFSEDAGIKNVLYHLIESRYCDILSDNSFFTLLIKGHFVLTVISFL